MRTTVSIGLAGCMMGGCVGFHGTSELKRPDAEIYAGYVGTSPLVMLGPLPHMGAVGFSYHVLDCFHGKDTLKNHPVLAIGVDPLDRVCQQYQGIDLRDYPASTADCFVREEDAHPRLFPFLYRHPWQTPNPSPECAKLIADIQAARKVQ